MKNARFMTGLLSLLLLSGLFISCNEETTPEPITLYKISGNVTYPNFSGTATPADGAVVYLSLDGTSTPVASTVANAAGDYVFTSLENGTYTVWANYDTENTNNPGGRMMGVIFMGEGADVTIADADAAQNIALTSAGQAEAVSVNTYEGGDYNQDLNHSIVRFEFPYDEENAPYNGQFRSRDIKVDFNPSDLAGSRIEASIDLLTVNTDSPGGRDPQWTRDEQGAQVLWTDATGAYKLGCISGTFGIPNPEDANRYATFTSTSIEEYGNGYLATGDMTFNGVTSDVYVFFQFMPGFDGTDRSGNPVRYSSFQASFDFAAKAVYGIESGHVGDADVTVHASFQVTKPL